MIKAALTSFKSIALASCAGAALIQGAAQASAQVATEAAQEIDFNIQAQSLGEALTDFALQSGQGVFFVPADVEGHFTAGVEGRHTPEDALNVLLRDADGVFHHRDARGTLFVERATLREDTSLIEPGDVQLAQAETISVPQDPDQEDRLVAETVIVTGTNIRGVENPTVPILKFDSEYFTQSGYATTGDFFRDLPQNFAEISPATLLVVSTPSAGTNTSQATGINLRGLGADATLVLLNGRRLVPAGTNASVDISAIPLSAIERIDILPGGGSAIYGSDAVGGVVNFVLKEDYNGSDTSLGYSLPTRDGGGQTFIASQSIGADWSSGNVLFAYEFRDSQNLTADERSFSSVTSDFFLPGLYDLSPSSEAQNILINFNQTLAPKLTLSGYGIYGTNDSFASRPIDPDDGLRTLSSENEQSTMGLVFAYDLSDDLVLEVGGTYNLVESRLIDSEPALNLVDLFDNEDEAISFDAKASGDLFDLPGGSVKYAVGGEFRSHESSLTAGGDALSIADRTQKRDVSSVFVELVIPLFGSGNRRSMLEALQLSLAGRYDEFSDAGSRTTPQIGLSWSPSEDLKFRTSYGESFKAPRFSQQTGRTFGVLFTGSDPLADDGRTPYLVFSGSPLPGELQPETSETFSIGFDYIPSLLPDFSISASYFDIEFDNRAGAPRVGSIFSVLEREDEIAPGVIMRNPTPEEISRVVDTATNLFNLSDLLSDPFVEFSGAEVIIDERVRNLSRRDTSGVDLTGRYSWGSAWGDFGVSMNMNYLFQLDQQDEPTAPVVELVDTQFNPVDFRARTGLTWSRNAFDTSVFIDYVDSYENTDTDTKIDSWMTADVRISADIGTLLPQYEPTQDFELSLAFQNLFDTDPPHVESRGLLQPVGFDPINADPLGRVVTIQFNKRW